VILDAEIIEVTDQHEIAAVSALAEEIWRQHFIPIIGEAQVKYMLAKFQSVEAITDQISDGYEYYLVKQADALAGYFGLVPDQKSKRTMISKLYTRLAVRGSGLGKDILRFIEARGQELGSARLWLTVNRFNQGPISWYLRRGFKVTQEVKTDIGGGFFMDDFIMEKDISSRVEKPVS
jgi:diamine N-acetyltransferase